MNFCISWLHKSLKHRIIGRQSKNLQLLGSLTPTPLISHEICLFDVVNLQKKQGFFKVRSFENMYLCVGNEKIVVCVRVWAWSPLERYGFQKDLAYKFTSMRIYDISISILSLISQTLLGIYFRMHNYYQIFSIPLPIVSPFVPGHTYSKMDGRVETLRRRQHSNEGPVSIPLPKIRYVTVQPTNIN